MYNASTGSQYGTTIEGSTNEQYGSTVDISIDGSVIAFIDHAGSIRVYEYGGSDYALVDSAFAIADEDSSVSQITLSSTNGSVVAYGTSTNNSSRGVAEAFENETLVNDSICFVAGSIVKTDQGDVKIEDIKPGHTINGLKVVNLISRVYSDNLIKIKQGAFGENVPNKDTYVTLKHKLMYNGELIRAKDIYKYYIKNRKKVCAIANSRVRIYNIMLEKYSTINVNGLVAESLHNEFDGWNKIL